MIDKAYREIQQTQHSTAYPYLPIFEASRENKEDEEDEEEDADLNDINTQVCWQTVASLHLLTS